MHRLFHVRSGSISRFTHAVDQFAAWDELRDRPAEEFGLLAEAEPDENADPFLIRTSVLMFRWGRDDDARRFIDAMMREGMPDTTEADLQAAGRDA